MSKINNKFLKYILLLFLLTLILITSFFGNLINIYSNNFDQRINNIYGFCSNESIGYLKYLDKKYRLNNNPKIINYKHTPNVDWAIINTKKINLTSNEIILLNYPGKNIYLNLLRESNNKYYINNLHFYSDKINKIDKIVLIFDYNVDVNNLSLDLYSGKRFGKKKLFKNFNNIYEISQNKYQIDIDLNINQILFEDNYIGFEINNLKNYKIKKIEIMAKNKFNVSDYKVIDNYDKCFLIRKND
tara:strand:- start:354 stop:1085 length:732 start_codon:yes stop_codon:yes gene_type:complete